MDGANVVGPGGEVRGFRRIAFDLILLSLAPGMLGKRDTRNVFGLALAGYAVLALELIELSDLGRIVITDRKSAGGRFVPLPASWLGAAWVEITSTAPTGVPELDTELSELSAASRHPVELQTWIAGRYQGQCESYLEQLAAAGAVRQGAASFIGPRWFLAEAGPAVQAGAQARLDEVARGSGPADPGQTAFGGLASAIGLGQRLYKRERYPRGRLEHIAAGDCLAFTPGQEQLAQAVRALVKTVTDIMHSD
jgi:Golgi phosphoprotein 3 (GPP34)